LTPPQLTPWLHSLPPILHKPIQKSMSSCSKGARGLSVLSRVAGIFTGTTTSLSISPRQRPTRYAIHAGRNFIFVYLTFVRDQTISSSCLKHVGTKIHMLYFSMTRANVLRQRFWNGASPFDSVVTGPCISII
jgi:hypothetical protein